MRWVPVLLACGCNSVFGLTPTELVDAPPPIDAPDPPRCPAIGTIPAFGDDLRSIPAIGCTGYATNDSGIAMAYCNNQVARGPVDGEMTPIMMDDPVYQPRLAPDGDELFALHYNMTTFLYELVDLVWRDNKLEQVGTYIPPSSATYGFYSSFSTPSRGPDRHIIYVDYNNTTYTYDLVEIANGTGTWTEQSRVPVTDLGLPTGATPMQLSLSPDGLRLVFMTAGAWVMDGSGQYTWIDPVFYADRASLTDRFSMVVALPSVPDQVQSPFLTADCGRIYFSALNRVFFLVQPPR